MEPLVGEGVLDFALEALNAPCMCRKGVGGRMTPTSNVSSLVATAALVAEDEAFAGE